MISHFPTIFLDYLLGLLSVFPFPSTTIPEVEKLTLILEAIWMPGYKKSKTKSTRAVQSVSAQCKAEARVTDQLPELLILQWLHAGRMLPLA